MCDGKGGELMIGKKIILLSGISLFTLTLAIAGCGKKEEPAPPPPPPPPAAEVIQGLQQQVKKFLKRRTRRKPSKVLAPNRLFANQKGEGYLSFPFL
jgi:hypothetical protein